MVDVYCHYCVVNSCVVDLSVWRLLVANQKQCDMGARCCIHQTRHSLASSLHGHVVCRASVQIRCLPHHTDRVSQDKLP